MDISIILPCYNGGKKLKDNLPSLLNYLQQSKHHYKLYVVNDGSIDDTYDQLKELKTIKLLSYKINRGKGGAIKFGLENIDKCDSIMLMDSDFPFDFKIIDDSIKHLNSFDLVVGSKFHKDSVFLSQRKNQRKITSKFCNFIVNSMFHFKLKDTQCGYKIMKYELAKLICSKQRINDWSFDVEYLYIAKLNGYKYTEIPVICKEDGISTVKIFKASIKFIISLFNIRMHKKYYKN